MTKQMKKSIIILVTIVLILSLFINVANATENNNDLQPSFTQKGVSIELKDSIKRSTYNNLLAGNQDVGSNYNLSEKYNIIVKNQLKTGSCWAFAYTSMIETTLKDNKEYSPMHIEYTISDMYDKTVGIGGNFIMALTYAASEEGPVLEKDFTFESVYDETKNSKENFYLADRSTVSLEDYVPEARIEDLDYFPQIYKSYADDGKITYKNTGGFSFSLNSQTKTYTENEVKAIRNLIKKHIKEDGAVVASFYTDIGITDEGEFVSAGGYYDNVNKSFYSKGRGFLSSAPNHAVTIVGWDDNFSKDNFADNGNKPKNDGAYIVLNSYGTEFGDKGYFYVSYDDYAIEQQILGINKITKVTESKDIKYKYEYDELGMNNTVVGNNTDSVYAANVFSKQDKKHLESLTEVGIYLDKAQGIEVYVNAENDNINNTKLVATYTGEKALEAGYHIIKLSSPIKLTGDKFVVKIKYVNEEGPSIPLESNFRSLNVDADEEILKLYDKAKSNKNESFISINGSDWEDLYTLKISGYTYKDTNACIKAFTVQGDEKVAVKGVSLDKNSLSIQKGEKTNLVATVKPTNALNKDVKWTSSDEKVATISEDGIILAKSKGTATITVTTVDGKYTATCKVTVTEKINTEDDIYKEDENKDQNKEEIKEETSKPETDKKDPEKNTDKEKDKTTAKDKIPQTGSKSIIAIVIIAGIVAFIVYRKNKSYKGIK